jgi:hypothetical protein
MPPQIKQDLNRSGWESTDFPSVCENCLPENPYVQMLKDDYGAECKIVCLRIFGRNISLIPCQISLNSRVIPVLFHPPVTNMISVHATVYNLPLEGRPHGANQTDEHLPDVRAPEELLPGVHAGPVVWPADRRA